LLYIDNPKFPTGGKAPSLNKYCIENENNTVSFWTIIKKNESMLLFEEQKVTKNSLRTETRTQSSANFILYRSNSPFAFASRRLDLSPVSRSDLVK